MNFSEICQKIRSLIAKVLTEHKELEEATQSSHLMARNSALLFAEAVKQVAPLQIKYSGSNLGSFSSKNLIWHEEFGIGVKISSEVKPLTLSEGDFQIENLVKVVQSQLDATLQRIQGKKDQVVQRTEKLEQLMAALKQWEQDSA